MKINYTMFGTGLTGGVRVLLEIANGLVERRHDVTITTLGFKEDTSWFPLKAKVNYLGTFSSHEESIRKLAEATPYCDINVATFCLTAFSVYRSGKGIPFYHMQHYEPLFFENYYLQKMAEESYCLPLNKIANSRWLKDQLKDKHNLDVIALINPAIDHNVFFPRKVHRESGRKKVVSLGRSERWKGFADAVAAMKVVMKEKNDTEFVVFGTNELLLELEDPNVPYTFVKSPVNDTLAALYLGADVVVSASWYESFPLPPLEAMACGVPVVTTKYGTEDYALNEVNALVVPPKDPSSLASAILRVLDNENLKTKLSNNGIETAKKFTWEETVNKVEKLFKKAIDERDASPSEIIKYKEELLRQKDAEISDKDRQLAEKERQLQGILNSWSWKITAPLRWIRSLLTKGLKR